MLSRLWCRRKGALRRFSVGLIIAAAAWAQEHAAIENGLRPPVQIETRPEVRWKIGERMAHYKVPSVSVAMIKSGKIEWAHAWGGATPSTLFQAASISKPVAAVAALRLVELGKLSLDEDVNLKLKTWKVPASAAANRKPVTLRGLLSHSAGLTISGFPGYENGVMLPTVAQILDGVAPANTKPVRVDIEPGTTYRYSGGGYTVMQQLMEDVTGKTYAEIAKELVLKPAGMKRSTYIQPLPAALQAEAARGYDGERKLIGGGWHNYPEQAAAGLWTTPSDLARFLIAVQKGKLLSAAMMAEMLTARHGSYGLGWELSQAGTADERFAHSGGNAGFRCYAFSYRNRGDGFVVMTNGDGGSSLGSEIVRSVAAARKWAGLGQELKRLHPMSNEELAAYAGDYSVGEMKVKLSVRGEGLALTIGSDLGDLFPESATRFFSMENGIPAFIFERDGSGKVTGFQAGRLVGTRVR